METNKMSRELTMKLQWDLANSLPPENHTNKLLRSYYLTQCKKIGRHDVQLPASKFGPSVMCSKCSSFWSEGKFSLHLKPQHIRSKKAQKLVETLNTEPKLLTRKQKTRAKWLKKRISSNVEIICGFCKKKKLQPLIKLKKTKVEEQKQDAVVETPTKKKKKKKDKFAGLKIEKVIPQKIKPNPPTTAKKPKVPPPKPTMKVVSKTQKQNSLLQLANLLKNRGPVVSSKPNNQLEKLLR